MTSKGIFDPEGKHKNPFTGEPYSDTYKELGKIWSKFPAYKIGKKILKSIKDEQVLLVISSTGSGKTVLVPKFMAHALDYKGKIAITLPKQIVTYSSAEFAAKTLDVKLGEEVGYKYRGSPNDSHSQKTKLLYATDGTIVAKLLNDPLLKEFDAVIIDEAHERKTQIDFMLYLLREVIKQRPEFKLIIMSATINSKIFEDYFKDYKFKIINVGGERNYPIKSIFLKRPTEYENRLEEGFKILVNILISDNPAEKGSHDIIFFITSTNEARDMCQRLQSIVDKEKDSSCRITCNGGIFCVEVYSGMDKKREELAKDKNTYKESGEYTRKVVMATNVAESSITIDGIKYVIDVGHEIRGGYRPEYRAKVLDRILITNAQAKQRMGRAGRTEPGICYHLYTEDEFNNVMERFPQPDIRTSDISGDCLSLLRNSNVRETKKLVNILKNFIEPPRDSYINDALDILKKLGCIDDTKITPLGENVSMISNSPADGISIIMGHFYGVRNNIAKILAMKDACNNNLKKFFRLPQNINLNKYNKDKQQRIRKQLQDKFNNQVSKFKDATGDHLTLLKLYDTFNDIYTEHYNNDKKKVYDWCYENFLMVEPLLKARIYYRKTARMMRHRLRFDNKSVNIELSDDIKALSEKERTLASLIIGYQLNTAVLSKKGYNTKKVTNTPINIDKTSFIGEIKAKHVFYSELMIFMGNASINIVSKISMKLAEILK